MSPRRTEPAFIWVRRNETFDFNVVVDGLNLNSRTPAYYLLKGKFTNGIIGEESGFECELDNNDESLSGRFVGNEDILFYYDFVDGTTLRFVGKTEKINKKFGETGNVINISGSNKFHSYLLDILVTEQFTGANATNMITYLFGKYAPSITLNNIGSFNDTYDFSWESIPLYDVVVDICNSFLLHAYIDSSGDLHLFERGSIANDDEAIVDFDNLIELAGIKEDLVDIKNKITIQSEDDDGLPILWYDSNASSESAYGAKETIIKDTGIINIDGASAVASANLNPDKEEYGSAKSYGLPSLMPGDKIWIVKPQQKIHGQYVIVKHTHIIPDLTTECTVAKTKNLQNIIKSNKQSTQRLEKLSNPNRMKYSLNLMFDDITEIDEDASNNVTVQDGALKLISGVTGKMVSKALTLPANVTEGELRVSGEALDTNTYRVCADTNQIWKDITKDEKISFTIAGSSLRVEATLNSASTRVNSIAVLAK